MSDMDYKSWVNDFLMFSKRSKEFISIVNGINNSELIFEICTAINVGVPENLLNDISDDMSVDTVKEIRDKCLRDRYNVDVTNLANTATHIGLKVSELENFCQFAADNLKKEENHLKKQLAIKEKELSDKENELKKLNDEYKNLEQTFKKYKEYGETKKEGNKGLGNMEHKSVEKENTDKKEQYTSEDNCKARIAFVKYLENYFCDKEIPEENKDFFLEFVEKDDTDFEMLMQAAKVKKLNVKQMKRLYEAMKRDIVLKTN